MILDSTTSASFFFINYPYEYLDLLRKNNYSYKLPIQKLSFN